MTQAGRDKDNQAKVAFNAADACVRSGTFALVLSLTLLAAIPYWRDRPVETALGTYVSLRLTLAGALDQLDGDPIWKAFESRTPNAESMPIAQLRSIKFQVSRQSEKANQPTTDNGASPHNEVANALSPPQNVSSSISGPLFELETIADSLTKLDDPDLLTKSRNASVFYNISIYRWSLKRTSLYINDAFANGQPSLLRKSENSEPNLVPSMGVNWLKGLSLKDARELAAFELPSVPDTTKFTMRDQTELGTSSLLPRGLYPASLCAEGLLMFVIAFFEAFTRELITATGFPLAGTVFSAFAKSRWTLATLVLAILLPFAATTAIAAVSLKWPLMAFAGVVGLETGSICILLNGVEYFHVR